jgi:hypothetical protein
MSVTINAKGTSVSNFTVGKDGTTLTQAGTITPPNGNDLNIALADDNFLNISGAGSGPSLITTTGNLDLHINPAVGGGRYLILNSVRWPVADGTNGQVLKTNGIGVLEWVNQAIGYSTESSIDVTTDDSAGVVVVTGMSVTPVAGTYTASFNCDCGTIPTSVTATANADLTTLYNALMALTPTNTTHPGAFGGETIGPGVYTVAAAVSITGVLTLDASDDANALFVIRCGAAFTTAAAASIVLINGASSANVFIVAEGAASTGASTIFKGTILANQAAASTGASTMLEGRILARVGAVSIASSTLTLPAGTSAMSLGVIAQFSMFTGQGDVSNAGASVINGDVGTNLGAATGFGSATGPYTIYLPGILNAESTLALYKNGTLVSASIRKRVTTTSIDLPFTLQTVVTASGSDVLDIRSSVTVGSMTIGNRIFTLSSIHVL